MNRIISLLHKAPCAFHHFSPLILNRFKVPLYYQCANIGILPHISPHFYDFFSKNLSTVVLITIYLIDYQYINHYTKRWGMITVAKPILPYTHPSRCPYAFNANRDLPFPSFSLPFCAPSDTENVTLVTHPM